MSINAKKLLASGIVGIALVGTLPLLASLGNTDATAVFASDSNYIRIAPSALGKRKTVNLGLNQSVVIDLPGDAHDILVSDPSVADAITRSASRIYVFGKQVGQTNLFIFDNSGGQLLDLELKIERDVSGLEKYLEKYIPGSEITVEMMNDNVILTGTVPTPLDSARAESMARIFVSGGEATTNKYNVNSSGGGGGTGASINYDDNEARQTSKIVNLLKIEGEDQVHLKVTVAEVQRSIVKQLGVNLYANNGTSFSMLSSNPLATMNQLGSYITGKHTNSDGDTIEGILRAMTQAGVMRTLAEPTLTAISGESATFKVGGEYNIPDGKDERAEGTTWNYKTVEYGISLGFSPVVLSPGRIALKIKTEVSEPTAHGSAIIPGYRGGSSGAPGIRRRSAETSVELPSGGSMIIAGLLQDDVRQVATGFPGLKDLPILGTLFRSREFQRYETELIIIATPYLVRPTARNNLARPDDNYAPASDGASNFLGRVNRVYGRVEGDIPPGQYHGNVGFIYK